MIASLYLEILTSFLRIVRYKLELSGQYKGKKTFSPQNSLYHTILTLYQSIWTLYHAILTLYILQF